MAKRKLYEGRALFAAEAEAEAEAERLHERARELQRTAVGLRLASVREPEGLRVVVLLPAPQQPGWLQSWLSERVEWRGASVEDDGGESSTFEAMLQGYAAENVREEQPDRIAIIMQKALKQLREGSLDLDDIASAMELSDIDRLVPQDSEAERAVRMLEALRRRTLPALRKSQPLRVLTERLSKTLEELLSEQHREALRQALTTQGAAAAADGDGSAGAESLLGQLARRLERREAAVAAVLEALRSAGEAGSADFKLQGEEGGVCSTATAVTAVAAAEPTAAAAAPTAAAAEPTPRGQSKGSTAASVVGSEGEKGASGGGDGGDLPAPPALGVMCVFESVFDDARDVLGRVEKVASREAPFWLASLQQLLEPSCLEHFAATWTTDEYAAFQAWLQCVHSRASDPLPAEWLSQRPVAELCWRVPSGAGAFWACIRIPFLLGVCVRRMSLCRFASESFVKSCQGSLAASELLLDCFLAGAKEGSWEALLLRPPPWDRAKGRFWCFPLFLAARDNRQYSIASLIEAFISGFAADTSADDGGAGDARCQSLFYTLARFPSAGRGPGGLSWEYMALIEACKRGHTACVRLLIEAGVPTDFDAQTHRVYRECGEPPPSLLAISTSKARAVILQAQRRSDAQLEAEALASVLRPGVLRAEAQLAPETVASVQSAGAPGEAESSSSMHPGILLSEDEFEAEALELVLNAAALREAESFMSLLHPGALREVGSAGSALNLMPPPPPPMSVADPRRPSGLQVSRGCMALASTAARTLVDPGCAGIGHITSSHTGAGAEALSSEAHGRLGGGGGPAISVASTPVLHPTAHRLVREASAREGVRGVEASESLGFVDVCGSAPLQWQQPSQPGSFSLQASLDHMRKLQTEAMLLNLGCERAWEQLHEEDRLRQQRHGAELLVFVCNPDGESPADHLPHAIDEALAAARAVPAVIVGGLAASAPPEDRDASYERLKAQAAQQDRGSQAWGFLFSGHAFVDAAGEPTLTFTDGRGRFDLPSRTAAELAQVLGGMPNLQLIFLNCGNTAQMAERLKADPRVGARVCIVCWSTLVADAAAYIFVRRFFERVAETPGNASARDFGSAFEHARRTVEEWNGAGGALRFVLEDPLLGISPPGRPNVYRVGVPRIFLRTGSGGGAAVGNMTPFS